MSLRTFVLSVLLFFISRGWFRKKVFRLGEGAVTRHTLFECKSLCSLYVHHIDTACQDRYHTHAFDARVWILSGGYTEDVKDGIGRGRGVKQVSFRAGDLRYIPRLTNHRLGAAAPDTYTLLFAGPWSHMWTEETSDGRLRILTNPGARVVYEA